MTYLSLIFYNLSVGYLELNCIIKSNMLVYQVLHSRVY